LAAKAKLSSINVNFIIPSPTLFITPVTWRFYLSELIIGSLFCLDLHSLGLFIRA